MTKIIKYIDEKGNYFEFATKHDSNRTLLELDSLIKINNLSNNAIIEIINEFKKVNIFPSFEQIMEVYNNNLNEHSESYEQSYEQSYSHEDSNETVTDDWIEFITSGSSSMYNIMNLYKNIIDMFGYSCDKKTFIDDINKCLELSELFKNKFGIENINTYPYPSYTYLHKNDSKKCNKPHNSQCINKITHKELVKNNSLDYIESEIKSLVNDFSLYLKKGDFANSLFSEYSYHIMTELKNIILSKPVKMHIRGVLEVYINGFISSENIMRNLMKLIKVLDVDKTDTLKRLEHLLIDKICNYSSELINNIFHELDTKVIYSDYRFYAYSKIKK